MINKRVIVFSYMGVIGDRSEKWLFLGGRSKVRVGWEKSGREGNGESK